MLKSCWKLVSEQVSIFILERKLKKKITPHYILALCLSQHSQSSRHPAVFLEQQQGSEVGDAILNGKEPLGFCRSLKSCSFLSWFHSEWEFCEWEKKSFRRCCSDLETASYEDWGLLCAVCFVSFFCPCFLLTSLLSSLLKLSSYWSSLVQLKVTCCNT